MNKSLRRRVAAVATTATVGGLLLPFLAAGSAFAATPTSLTVSPTSAATNTSTARDFTVTAVGGIPAAGIYSQVVTGPDAAAAGTPCTIVGAGPTFTCTVTPGATPGTDNLRFFYHSAGSTYAPGDPTTTANLTVAGPVSRIVLAPATSSVAASVYGAYTATATDVGGRTVVSAAINADASEANTSPGDLKLSSTAPAAPGYVYPNVAASSSTTTAKAATINLTAGDSYSSTPGVAKFYVASRNVGAVAVSVVAPSNAGVGNSGVLTVNGGMPNDVSKVSIAPATQRAFFNATVPVVVNLQNKQGNPVAGVLPVFSILSGPSSLATVTPNPASGLSDATGNVTESYPAAAVAGQDKLQAYVNYAGGQNTLEAGEPSGTAVVNVAADDVVSIGDNGKNHDFAVPLSSSTATIKYTVVNGGQSRAGYNVKFVLANVSGNSVSTLSAASAITDTNGSVSVTVTNPTPTNNDQSSVTASLGAQNDVATVTYAASAVSNNTISIAPFANTTTANGTATFSASATDQFGAAQTGLIYDWVVSGRNSAVSSASSPSPTFSYSDTGAPSSAGFDTVNVSARNANGPLGSTNVTQYWVTTTGMATQANIDLGTAGAYAPNNTGLPAGQTGPIIASGFTTTKPAGVTADPTPTTTATVQTVLVKLTDSFPNALYGKSVTLSSSGVGVFTDYKGNPLGTSTTAVVSDGSAHAKPQYANFTTAEAATVFVRSTQSGTQTITATVDGITTTGTVTYSGQFVGVTPTRVMNTRTGTGGLLTGANTTAPAGPLAPDTSYTLNYGAAGMPLDAAAYAFNITAINPGGLGNLRVAPGNVSQQAPTTSLINYQSGSDVANFVIVPNITSAPGVPVAYANALQLYSAASSADVAIDLVGYYAATPAGSINTTTPSRIANTSVGGTPVAVGETRSFQVAGLGGIPATSAKAVALNVTAINPGGLGNLRIFADGDAVPPTSNINYIAGQDKSAFVIVNLPANGKIDVYSAGSAVNVAIDAYASFDKVSSNIVTQTPVRILYSPPDQTLSAGQTKDLQVSGSAGVPANAQAVLVSITAIHTTGSTGSGNLRVYPSGGTVPNVSTLNYVSPTADVANFAIVPLGANGKISIASFGSPTDVAVDVLGFVPAG